MHLYGSVTNRLAENMIGRPEPDIGMGATLYMWSDRLPYTIVKVVRFKTGDRAGQVSHVHAQKDHATRTDSRVMSEDQTWDFTPNPNGHIEVFRVNKAGQLKGNGGTLGVGHREKYHDFTL